MDRIPAPHLTLFGKPAWFDERGVDEPTVVTRDPRRIVLRRAACKVTIEAVPAARNRRDEIQPGGWDIRWEGSESSQRMFAGSRRLTTEQLIAAFALDRDPSDDGRAVLLKNKFLRFRDWLSMPPPRKDEAPVANGISIKLNDQIRDAIRRLVQPMHV